MKKIEVICSDADGIVNDLETFQNWMINDYFTSKGEKTPEKKNPTAYDVKDQYELSKIQRDLIWLKYFPIYCQKFGPRSNVAEVFRYWQYIGKEVDIATARAFVTNFFLKAKVINWFEVWLQQNGIKPKEIIYCSEKLAHIEKVKAFNLLNADFGIEDKSQVLENLLDVCDIATINTSYNSEYEPVDKPFKLYRHAEPNAWLKIKKTVDTIDNNGKGCR